MLCPLLLAFASSLTQDPSAPAALLQPAPGWVVAYGEQGELLWRVIEQAGDLPPQLAPENAHGLLDGRWSKDGAGNWFWRECGAQVPELLSAPSCLPFDPPSVLLPAFPGASVIPSTDILELPDGEALVPLFAANGANFQVGVSQSLGHGGQWSPLQVLDTLVGFSGVPDAAISPNGDITLLYRTVSGGYNVWAVRFTEAAGWGAPVLVHNDAEFIQTVDLVPTADNDLWVAVEIGQSGRAHVLRYTHASDTWGAPMPISPQGVRAISTTIRSNSQGTRFVVAYVGFSSPSAANDGIWANAWNPSTQSWGLPLQLPGSNPHWFGGADQNTEVALQVESNGDALIAYSTFSAPGQPAKLRSNRFTGTFWEPFVDVADLPFANDLLLLPQVSSLTEGDVAHWALLQNHPTQSSAYIPHAVRHEPGSGWFVDEVGPTVNVQFFQPIPRGRLVNYAGERLALTYNDNSTLLGLHFNGDAWSAESLPVPAVEVASYALGRAAGEALFVSAEGEIRASWMHGSYGFSNLGGGLAGTSGVPVFGAACDQVLGQSVDFTLQGAAPNAPAFLVVGLGRVDLPLLGGVLVPSPDFVQPALLTDGSGGASLQLSWSVNQPAGFGLFYQYWILDPAGPQGFAISNALSGVTP